MRSRWAVLPALLTLTGPAAAGDPLVVQGGYSELQFAGDVTPVRWTVCERRCDDPSARRAVLFSRGDGGLTLSDGEGARNSATLRSERNATAVRVIIDHGQQQYIYELLHDSAEVRITLPADTTLELMTGSEFVPEQLPGFGQIYSRVRAVAISDAGQTEVDDLSHDEQTSAQVRAGDGTWAGMRNRYWALLFHPATPVEVALEVPAASPDQPRLRLQGAAGYRVYAGPVEWASLTQVAPELSELLFAALWDLLRALTFGMMLLYGVIQSAVGSHGLAIILLSLVVKVLMYPLTALADRWQREVNSAHSILQPEIAAIRREYKGEEAHKRTLEVYRKHSISQFYTFKSAAGFLIQIPVFIAAFDMLAENFALNEIGFLWIADLAKPDAFAALPFTLPFFGGTLNLLPFLMSFLSVLAALLQREDSLSTALQRQQSFRLYLLSAAFFVLFYTFPAGMVLYWTSSNLFHLIKVESGRVFMRK